MLLSLSSISSLSNYSTAILFVVLIFKQTQHVQYCAHLHRILFLPHLETKPSELRSSDIPKWQRCHLSILHLHPQHQSITENSAVKDKTMNTSQWTEFNFHLKHLPNLCDPAKKERERTNGLSEPPERVIRPSAVAMCCKKTKQTSNSHHTLC